MVSDGESVHRSIVTTVLAALTALALVTGCSSAASSGGTDEIVFAAVPSEESQSLQQSYDPLVKLLERETGRPVRFQNVTNYAAVIEGMRAGQIQLAAFGPFSYVLARQQGVRVSPVGAPIEEPGAQPGYVSYGVAPAGSPVRSLADFRGRTVCFVDPNSTSGYLYPSAGLLENGIDPRTGVRPIFAGGHDASALAVANGQCEAGFAFDTIVDTTLIESGQLQPGRLATLWRSPTIPGAPVAMSDDLPQDVRDRVTNAFATMVNADYLRANGFCQGECPIGDDDAVAYVPVDDAFYNGVRDVCAVTRDPACTES